MDDWEVKHLFLPGVPAAYVIDRLTVAGGDEIGSGKLAHPESSAALAVNTFGWFVDRPSMMPSLPGTAHMGLPDRVEVEYCARFPWSGGRHPWLDAAVFTGTHLIGVESKRFEPFRDRKTVSLSPTYDRPVWGERMFRYSALRDGLRSGSFRFDHLDAAQLVKHAYGLVTDARRLHKRPVLFYLFAEPTQREGCPIKLEDIQHHRKEIIEFAAAVDGDEVLFYSSSYREWLDQCSTGAAIRAHRRAIEERFTI
jgi:hypothetical protein